MIIDASDLILGRMGTFVAKKILLGEKVDIVNSELAVISGNKEIVFNRYKELREMANQDKLRKPIIPRRPDLFVKRAIKRMVPHKKNRGKEALKNLKCFIGVPEEMKSLKFETIPNAKSDKLICKFVTVKEICLLLGGK